MIGKRSFRYLLVGTALSVLATTTQAQEYQIGTPPRAAEDGNGVDLFLGTYRFVGPTISMGGKDDGALTFRRSALNGYADGDNLRAEALIQSTKARVSIGGSQEVFNKVGTNWVSEDGTGSTFTYNYVSGAGNGWSSAEYKRSDGTAVSFRVYALGTYSYWGFLGKADSVVRANGARYDYSYDTRPYCGRYTGSYPNRYCDQTVPVLRLRSVTSTDGYSAAFNYTYSDNYVFNSRPSANFSESDSLNSANISSWTNISSVSLKNTKSSSSPTITVPYYSYSDAAGNATTITAGSTITVTRPSSASPDVTVNLNGAGKVANVTNAAGTTSYSFVDSGNTRTTTVTDPLGHASTYVFDISLRRMLSSTDATGRTTSSQYDSFGRLKKVAAQEGNATELDYDANGNVTETRQVSKTPGTPATLVTTVSFPCATAATCNKPTWTKDAKGNQTDYTYDSTTGNVTSITSPPDVNGVRATKTFTYTNVNGVARPQTTTICATAASCAGGAKETQVIVAYNANGLPTTVTAQAGDGSMAATTTATYDDIGNPVSVDGPLPGADDTVYYRYNANRQVVGVVAPDPDGGGALQRAAQRSTFDVKGRATVTETGTVADASDPAWSAFSSAQQVTTTHDGVDRPLTQTLTAVGTTYSSTENTYDHHRLDQSKVVMFGNGADRVTKYGYDKADRQTKVTTAYGTAEQSDDATVAYTPNGQQQTLTDANGNVTTYGYDGFDRLVRTTYADGSYEQLTPDANGNITSRRVRDGQVIGYGYDALNRLVSKDRPNSAYWETDQGYAYDLLGNLTQASDSNGRVLGFAYDALGRRTSQSDNWYIFGNASFLHDAAGRRTRLTWGDGAWVGYDYLTTGAMNTIRDSAGNALVTFGYDDLGRRTSLTRANGTVTNYGYDPASRLNVLTLAGGNQPTSITMDHNPAGQIVSRTGSNDAYAWTGHANVDRDYGVNGLNQLTSAGATPLGYDGRGNLTSSGPDGYIYTADNQLAMRTGVAGLAYDPLGRLFNGVIDPGVNTTLTYDGADVIAELDQANPSGVLRRYVYGPGTDEPLIWYEGAGFSDRRWLHADERGSIVEVTNDAGNAIAVNSYDEFGIPAAGNLGRFQYTGQKWLPSVGLYDYKARMYSPTLGRFMQTDPIGYSDGMNWYNYVGSDPVNATDPSGLCTSGYVRVGYGPGYTISFPNGSVMIVGGPEICRQIPTSPDGFRNGPGSSSGSSGSGNAPTRPQNVCSAPLSGSANRGQTVNSRRAQVRRELSQAIRREARSTRDGAIQREFGRNVARLTPNVGTWIRGGTSRADGNYLYGAVTAELGIPLSAATGLGDAAEFVDDILDRLGLGSAPDEGIGRDSPEARAQIAAGARCPG